MVHLLRRAFEQPPAADREQRISAIQHAIAVKRDMGARVSRNFEDAERDTEMRQREAVAFAYRIGDPVDARIAWPIDRNGGMLQQRAVAAHVVGMMMRIEDGDEIEALALEIVDHRRRIARIDYRGTTLVADGPYVIVRERRQGNDFIRTHTVNSKKTA